MNEHLTCFVDLDGVIADFDKRVSQINGGVPTSTIPRGKLWASIQKFNDEVEPFFGSLDMMPDARILWDYVTKNFVNVAILSACGYTPRDGAAQKKAWVAKHLGRDVVVKVVTGSGDKAAFATRTSILIDDREKSIIPWVNAGGIGILHRNATQTIHMLEDTINAVA
jgi:5'-nucleotidase